MATTENGIKCMLVSEKLWIIDVVNFHATDNGIGLKLDCFLVLNDMAMSRVFFETKEITDALEFTEPRRGSEGGV